MFFNVSLKFFNVSLKWNFDQIHWVEKHQSNQNHHWTDYMWATFLEFERVFVLLIVQLHYLFKLHIIQNFELRKLRSDITQDGSVLIIESSIGTLICLRLLYLEVCMFLLTLVASIYLYGNLAPSFGFKHLSTLSSLIFDLRHKPTSWIVDSILISSQKSFVVDLLFFLQCRLFWIYWHGLHLQLLIKEASEHWIVINFWLIWDLIREFLLLETILKLVCNWLIKISLILSKFFRIHFLSLR